MRDSAGIASPLSDPPKAGLMWNYGLGRFEPPIDDAISSKATRHRLAAGWDLRPDGWWKPCRGPCKPDKRPLRRFHARLLRVAGQTYSVKCQDCTRLESRNRTLRERMKA